MICLSCSPRQIDIPVSRVNQSVAYGYDYTIGNGCIQLVDLEITVAVDKHTAGSMRLLCEVDLPS